MSDSAKPLGKGFLDACQGVIIMVLFTTQNEDIPPDGMMLPATCLENGVFVDSSSGESSILLFLLTYIVCVPKKFIKELLFFSRYNWIG